MTAPARRWALSFADLALLLLGFVVLLQARPDRAPLAAGLHQALGAPAPARAEAVAADLFQPGEALLTPRGRAFAAAFVRTAAGRPVLLDSRGTDGRTRRLDGWELAAARAAALGRALVAAGIPRDRLRLALADAPGGQRLTLSAG